MQESHFFAGAYDDCEGCWVDWVGNINCTNPAQTTSYIPNPLTAPCAGGNARVVTCVCTGVDYKLIEVACKTCS